MLLNNKKFIFSILVFVNITLLAHNFIPHHHHCENESICLSNDLHNNSDKNSNDCAKPYCCYQNSDYDVKDTHISYIINNFSKLHFSILFLSFCEKDLFFDNTIRRNYVLPLSFPLPEEEFIYFPLLRGPPIS